MLWWDLARRPYYASPSARSGREIDMAVPEEGCDARHCVRVVEAPLLLAVVAFWSCHEGPNMADLCRRGLKKTRCLEKKICILKGLMRYVLHIICFCFFCSDVLVPSEKLAKG